MQSTNAAVTSLLVIGKLGTQDYLERHNRELTGASLFGKVCLAISVAPVFVLVAAFKIGCLSIVCALWIGIPLQNGNYQQLTPIWLILLAVVPPAVIICLTKIFASETSLTAAAITQGVFAETVSLHFWQCKRLGKQIGIGMITYNLILYSSFLDWIIVDPSSKYDLGVAIYVCLRLGWVCFLIVTWTLLYEEKYVGYMVDKFPQEGKDKNIEEGKEVESAH